MSHALPAPGSLPDREMTKLVAQLLAKLAEYAPGARDDGEDDLAAACGVALSANITLIEALTHREDNSPQSGPQARGETE